MSIAATHWAMTQKLLPITKMILLTLADHHNGETQQCNPSMKRISDISGASPRTVVTHLQTLEELRLLTIEHKKRENGSQTTNWYHLKLDIRQDLSSAVVARTYARSAQTYATDAPLEPVTEPVIEPIEETKVPSLIHRDVFKRIQAIRGYPSGNGAAEGQAIKSMLKEYSADEIVACYEHLKTDHFWNSKSLTMMTVKVQIGEWKNNPNFGASNDTTKADRKPTEPNPYTGYQAKINEAAKARALQAERG